MASVDLIFNGNTTTVQCNENETIEEILIKFGNKAQKNTSELSFLYGGQIIDVNKTFNETANSQDKERKKITILVTDIKNTVDQNQDLNLKKSKYIICPKCYDIISINAQNFKIKLYACKNGHIINNLSFLDFNNSQLIDESKIICDICKNTNKANTYNNSFFVCNTCNKNICPLCNSSHDKDHIRIDYEQKYFKCNIHNELFSSYCKQCNKNICILCEKEHQNHNKISFGEILPDNNKLEEVKNELRQVIDDFKNDINEIINKLNNVISYIGSYYNIYDDLIKGYDIQKRNYQILQNLVDINKYNNGLINELNNIIKDNNIFSKLRNITNIYFKIFFDNYEAKINQSYIITKKIKEYEDGIYEGEFKDDKREGKGVYIWKDGEKYEGEWKNDKREGKGILHYNEGDRYEGEYKNNIKEGKGIMYYKDGNRYEGEWKNNKREGKGIFYWINGDKYEGDFKGDITEGKGIYYWNNGDRYEGDWKKDKREGQGVYYFSNGDREMGNYLNDKKVGKHAFLTIKGKVKNNNYK